MPTVICTMGQYSDGSLLQATHVFQNLDFGSEAIYMLVILSLEVVYKALTTGYLCEWRRAPRRRGCICVRAKKV